MKRTPAKPINLNAEQIAAIEDKVFQLVESTLDARFYLVATAFEKEMGYWYLRVYVDKPDFSISLGDCEEISRSLDAPLETIRELSDFPYSFEVSSPGLFRPLATAREFAFYRNRPVRVQENPPPVKLKANARKAPEPKVIAEGTLTSFEEATRTLTLRQGENTLTVPLQDNLVVYLNPVIHFPDDEEDTDTSGETADFDDEAPE